MAVAELAEAYDHNPAQSESEPLTIKFATANRMLGVGHSRAYQMVREGTYPVPVIKLGPGKFVVPKAPLLKLLGVRPS